MLRLYIFFWLIIAFACKQAPNPQVDHRYRQQAERVTIIRDEWGVPHIYGKTDADAVFGLMYAQCEESFERVERAYIKRLGRMAELEGEAYLVEDIKARMVYDTSAAIADYNRSPQWMKKLLHAFADGINYYLYKNPDVKPLLIKTFHPWYPLMFTDGAYISFQTGGLLNTDVQQLYLPGRAASLYKNDMDLPVGSNAFAIGSSKSESGKPLLYINPHVSFYFRSEMHMVSDEGLNAYGAVTWGNFFVYSGFNQHCGWMHTSSQADGADLYEEKTLAKQGKWWYSYNDTLRAVIEKQELFRSKGDDPLTITTYYTHHGPVMGKRNNKWLAMKGNNRSLEGLMQSWLRTKASSLKTFSETLNYKSNPSTNTMYADRDGNIAYWHGNFVPERNSAIDWSLPVDGSTSATEWNGLHETTELIQFINPTSGWLQNCNASPFYAASKTPVPFNAPQYLAPEGQNFRSIYAIDQLHRTPAFSMQSLIALGYSHYLPSFDSLLPPLFAAYDKLNRNDLLYSQLSQPLALLKQWDKRSSVNSTATTLAILWAYSLLQNTTIDPAEEEKGQAALFTKIANTTPGPLQLDILNKTVSLLQQVFGNWQLPWGELNRFQRLNADVYQKFDDSKPSEPVGLASAIFGSLPSYETSWSNTRRGYGIAGNSFVAVVEFGEKIKARSVIPGGQLFDANSKHFNDQSAMFIQGKFKDVLFYKEDVERKAVSKYHPGENWKQE